MIAVIMTMVGYVVGFTIGVVRTNLSWRRFFRNYTREEDS